MPLIGIFGTFDVENFGDLLFPLIAARQLGEAVQLVAVSPTATGTRFADALPPVSVDEFARSPHIAGMLIGGGNIIHLRELGIPLYADVPAHVAYPSLWIGATMLGAIHHCPVIWNAPGVLTLDPATAPRPLLAATLAGATYLAVRDGASADLLQPFAQSAPAIVPDTALDLDALWPRQRLAATLRRLLSDNGFPDAPPTLAIHVKQRSLGALSVDAFAAALGRLGRDLVPVLLAIGRVHGDGELARAISARLDVPHVTLDAPNRLEDIAAVLAGSRAAAVASLHGFIAATAYGTPAALVAVPDIAKFRGFAAQAHRSGDVVADWPGAFAHLADLGARGWPAPPPPVEARRALARHWDRVREILAPGDECGGGGRHVLAEAARAACATTGLTSLLAAALPSPQPASSRRPSSPPVAPPSTVTA